MMTTDPSGDAGPLIARYSRLPAEGEDGLFTQTWLVVCRSEEVAPGQVIGRPFLDGRVVVCRTNAGAVQVLSAYCPHVGADLAIGDMIDDTVRCAFHRWRYDMKGHCAATAIGDPAPAAARLFRFPTVERWGLIFAFNGNEALWDLPDFKSVDCSRTYADDDLLIVTDEVTHAQVDPWVVCSNTLDVQHAKTLHDLRLTMPDKAVFDGMRWTPHDVTYEFDAIHWGEKLARFSVGIFGTSLFYQSLLLDGEWFGVMAAMAMPRPGYTVPYFILATSLGDGSPEARADAEALSAAAWKLEVDFYDQDRSIFETIRFRHGTLTRSDVGLGKFLEHVRAYPRAHPSAAFIV